MTDLQVAAPVVLERAEAQATVFAEQPSRMGLLELPKFAATSPLRVRVHRNLAAERLLTPATPLARFAGFELQAEFEAYDDTLSFAALQGDDPDVELVWVDAGRLSSLSGADLAGFLADRLRTLRGLTSAPILVFDLPGTDARAEAVNAELKALSTELPSVGVCPQSEVAAELGDRFASTRASDLTAVPLSPVALTRLAQRLGLCWLPAAAGRLVRGVAVDLDNTFYSGVLGEDGIDGIVVTPAHLELQKSLKALHERGIFIAILSKNEPADVEALFAQRTDFALTAADVDAWGVGWGDKSAGLERAAEAVRVSPGTFLFVDDNAGELVEVGSHHPDVFTIHAADADLANRALGLAPGLFRFGDAGADLLRTRDLAAETQRREIRQTAADPRAYLAALDVVLTYGVDQSNTVKRLAELSSKTNQFSTALARLDELQLANRVGSDNARVLSIALSDRLADAGIIAMISAQRQSDDTVTVEDVCVSCRALGRGLEAAMLGNALARVAADLGVRELRINRTEGPRNGPGLAWLAQLGGRIGDDHVVVPAPAAVDDLPITITWES